MAKPRLLILSFSNLTRDARLLKQISEFAGSYEVHTCGYGPTPKGVTRHWRLKDEWTSWEFGRAWLLSHRYGRAYWSNPAVKRARGMLEGQAFDAIIANDYDTVPLALSLKSTSGVHADLHEYAVGQQSDTWKWNYFVRPFRRWVCKTYLPQCSSMTVVCDGISRRYAEDFGVESNVAWNATPYVDLSPTPVESPIKLVHHGVSHRDRNLAGMIEGVIRTTTPVTFDLFLVDTDSEHIAELKRRYADYPQIRVNEAIPYDDLVRTLNQYDVGVFVLPPVTINYEMALPNKFFDFIQARLGIIVGPSPEMAALVRQVGNGMVTKDFQDSSLTAVLDDLTPEKVAQWKERSNQVAQEFSAEQQTVIWRRALEDMIGSRREGNR